MANNDAEKTSRIGYLCWTIVTLGLLFFLFKINACNMACNAFNSPNKPDPCKDEFFEMKLDSKESSYHTCTPGARVEIVASPPAPKPGILCHCINNPDDAGGASAPPR